MVDDGLDQGCVEQRLLLRAWEVGRSKERKERVEVEAKRRKKRRQMEGRINGRIR